jgi:Polyketide cyclase / dehydrase and lipid transport
MATIIKETLVEAPAPSVWEALRDFGAVHERLAPGFVVDSRLEGDVRTVTFANGAVAKEALVGIDEQARRLAYAVVESGLALTHHNASASVVAEEGGRSRFVWVTDVLPDEAAPVVAGMMEQGLEVMRRALAAT